MFSLCSTVLADWIVVAIDIEFTVTQTMHVQDCCCMKVTTMQIPNVTWLVKEQVSYFRGELASKDKEEKVRFQKVCFQMQYECESGDRGVVAWDLNHS